jgi:exosortase
VEAKLHLSIQIELPMSLVIAEEASQQDEFLLPARTQLPVVPLLVSLAIAGLLYAGVLAKLLHDWWTIPDFSHGFIVPFFAAYLFWLKRDRLRAAPLRPSYAGILIVFVSQATLIIGVYGSDLFLSRFSGLLLLVGLVVTFWGWAHARILSFGLLVLLLAIPIPALIFNQITFPLQTLASSMASALLPLFNVPVFREGHVINLPSMPLEVAEACSGIRSLMSLGTLAVIYGYFLENSFAKRLILVLASVPIAVAANALRIVGTGLCVQYWNPDKALGFFHEFSGWVVFLVSLALLYTVHLSMRSFSKEQAQ